MFTLSAFTSAQTFTYQVSLDVTSRNYIGSVISTDPKDKKSQIWLEEIFPQSFRKAVENGEVFGILPTLYFNNNIGNFAQEFKTPLSPWLVSDLKGNRVFRLFRFIAISDGKAANREIKISISNINLDTREFDVEVRDYNDTDNRVSILEQFTRCSLDPRSNNYIAQKIGDGVRYNIQSRYIFLEMAENAPIDGVAAGFEGYTAKLYGAAQTVSNIANNLTIDPPKMYYNLAYDTRNDRVNRVYLGVSERGFDATGYRASTLDGSRFDFSDDTFEGIPVTTGMTKGFHMDSGVTETEMSSMFETTPYGFQTEEQVVGTPFERIIARKFTVALAGGFDGWDIYRTSRTNTDQFKAGGLFYRRSSPAFNGTQLANEGSDWYAWKEGIDLLTLSEDTQMELIATPSLNISDHRSLVSETLENVEEQGTALYIINLPDIEPSATYAEEVVDLLDQSDFDTNYAATYAPWVLMSDVENGGSLYVPPTAEVFRTMARTDNVTFPWFAAAGLTRGTLQSNRARMILRENDREILYKGRINPIATFDGSPTIWGQKTLQVRQSPLDRINVRRLLLRAARIVISQTRILLFDPNDNVTVTRFEDILNSIFRNIREQRGVTDFFVKVTAFNTAETRERNELIGEIYLKPTKTAEIIKVGFNITPESFNFAEL
ncbi:MAG: hypothetical protein DDT42_01886 [candidate division WS2 bacterium]|uniref:Tail sheath protein C-terminal domain-containing protein n=1 Tax=Psychracetigena formicireducens TaxID=2986056 RepID=A0A9E2F2Q4_PSYF1|nr:hypothetical protein [Candidatus Psychracetigena formicireducens]